jgi:hypothetical protein
VVWAVARRSSHDCRSMKGRGSSGSSALDHRPHRPHLTRPEGRDGRASQVVGLGHPALVAVIDAVAARDPHRSASSSLAPDRRSRCQSSGAVGLLAWFAGKSQEVGVPVPSRRGE